MEGVSLVSALEKLKTQIAFAGTRGVNLYKTAILLNLSDKLVLFLAKQYLSRLEYSFNDGTGVIDIALVKELGKTLVCTAPMHILSDFYGLETFEDATSERNEEFAALEMIAAEQERGVTATELIQKMGKGVVGSVDRLVTRGCIIKRLLMPMKVNGATKFRSQGSVTLYHIKRCARFFRPELDNSQLYPGDIVRNQVYNYLRDILDRNQVDRVSAADLSVLMGTCKKTMQYLRTQVIMQVKAGSDCPINFVETETRPMKRSRLNGLGKQRTVWCLVRNDDYCHPGGSSVTTCSSNGQGMTAASSSQAFYKIRNLSTFDQLEHYIHQYQGIGSNEIRRYASVGRKRAGKISADLSARCGYPTIKVQEGKQLVFKIMPKTTKVKSAGLESADPPLEGTAEDSALHPMTEEDEEIPKSLSSRSRALKRIPAAPTLSVEQEEKYNIIMDYLRTQPLQLGCVLEVTQLIRLRSREQGATYKVDRKTVIRTVETMVQRGLIELQIVDLPPHLRENFNNQTQAVIIFFANDRQHLEHRIDSFLSDFVYVRKRYGDVIKKAPGVGGAQGGATAAGDEPEESMDMATVDDEPPLDEAMHDSGKKRRRTRKNAESLKSATTPVTWQPPSSSLHTSIAPFPFPDYTEDPDEEKPQTKKKKKVAARTRKADLSRATVSATDEGSHPTTAESLPPPGTAAGEAAEASGGGDRPCVALADTPSTQTDGLEDNVLWVNRSSGMTCTGPHASFPQRGDSLAVHQASGEGGSLQSSTPLTEGEWTLEEDFLLLEMFVQHFLVRRAKLGLPVLLKPVKKVKRVVGAKYYFVVYPHTSCLHLRWQDMHISTLRQYYLINCCVAVGGHTLSSARRRLPIVLKAFTTMKRLVSTLLYYRRAAMQPVTLSAVDYTLSTVSPEEESWALLSVLKHISHFGDHTFGLKDLLPDLSDDRRVRMVIRVLRELYMHGILRRAGNDEDMEDPHETQFYFSRVFLSHAMDNPFGGMYDELLCAGGATDELTSPVANLDAEAQAMRSFLLIAHQLCYTQQAFLHSLPTQADDQLRDVDVRYRVRDRTVEEGEDTEMDTSPPEDAGEASTAWMGHSDLQPPGADDKEAEGQPLREGPVLPVLVYNAQGSVESGPVGRALDRLSIHLSASCTFPQLYSLHELERVLEPLWQQPELGLPWMDYPSRSVEMDVYRFVATAVLAYLSDHSGATLSNIQCALVVLPQRALEVLLESMVQMNLLRCVELKHMRRLHSPFDSLARPDMGAAGQLRGKQESKFYEIALGPL